MATQERSSGVVVFHQPRRSGAQRKYLLLDYGRHWDYPKGHLDQGEDDLSAALRELAEETGLSDVEFIPGFAREIVYFFRHPRRGLIRKQVIFFLGQTHQTRVQLSDEHVGYEFLPFEQALKRLTYPTAKQVLREAHAYLEQRA